MSHMQSMSGPYGNYSVVISSNKKGYSVEKTNSTAKNKEPKRDDFINTLKDSLSKEQKGSTYQNLSQKQNQRKDEEKNFPNEKLTPNCYDYISYNKLGQEKEYDKLSSFDCSL